MEHHGLNTFIDEMEKSFTQLSFSLIIAALIIGSSLIIQANVGPQLWNLPLIGILGLWLIFTILRSGKL